MSTTQCVCGVPVTNGYLCTHCLTRFRNLVRDIPEWADQLEVVRLRLTRFTPGNEGRRNRETALPYNPAYEQPAQQLDTLIRSIAATMNIPTHLATHRLVIVAAWISVHMHYVNVNPESQTWLTKLQDAISQIETIVDRPPETWYAGKCPCGKDLYPTTTASIVSCPECAHTWSVAHRRNELLRQAKDVIAPGPDIARALTGLGSTVTPEKLRKWRHAGKLKVREFDPGPPPTNKYRVGDVIDLLTIEQRKTQPGKEHR